MVTSPVKGGRLSFSRPRTQLTFPVLRISHQFLRSQLLFVTRDACYSFSVPTLKERVPRSRLSACKKGFFLRGFLFLFSKAYVSVIGFTVSTLEALLASELLEQVPPFSVFAWLRLTATPASENSCVKRRSTKHSQTCSLKNSPLRPVEDLEEMRKRRRQLKLRKRCANGGATADYASRCLDTRGARAITPNSTCQSRQGTRGGSAHSAKCSEGPACRQGGRGNSNRTSSADQRGVCGEEYAESHYETAF
ncbi:programmed cell death 5 protein [Toxoplasma gondii ME49]|uniref:Programmed cell death 5 protein n=2 Tax=Toxoplasma gondii TaxID=5811 RepID=A0A125YXG0_TOXGV|nr:programmed cell death 5 protein [Toxoplasma gondii ME49]EPT32443.1 programmed cell death 5 protein [Toxoplasma gondii ME49]ESS29387.1 programmed cell death 5 protein [Toxoplasma gondii VEG]|eukprot:XP_018638510.1 programmed cell death 5 protein [Toxoplasma gondii ME49]